MTNLLIYTALSLFTNAQLSLFSLGAVSTHSPIIPDPSTQGTYFELPLSGATGYSMLQTQLQAENNYSSQALLTLSPGDAFCILQEEGAWWLVSVQGVEGWIPHESAMINLPDVLPSVIYDNANAHASVVTSMGYDLPRITGEALYDVSCYNDRLEDWSDTMPLLYASAKRFAKAQAYAKAEGNSLVLIEAFRPYETQMILVESMMELLQQQPHISRALSAWGLDYFVATGVSSHQQGIAVDVTLAQVLETERRITGDLFYEVPTVYEAYQMPTAIHDLCLDAASMPYPIALKADWASVPRSSTMNQASILLQNYCTQAGFYPLASEWWHFNDLSASNYWRNYGDFYLSEIVSVAPETSF